MDAYSYVILRMAEDRIRDLRREAGGYGRAARGRRRWFRRRPAGNEPVAAPVVLTTAGGEPDELRRTA